MYFALPFPRTGNRVQGWLIAVDVRRTCSNRVGYLRIAIEPYQASQFSNRFAHITNLAVQVAPYAMTGTDIAYSAMLSAYALARRCPRMLLPEAPPQLPPLARTSGSGLRARYTMSGTDMAYASIGLRGTDMAHCAIGLRGTDISYAALAQRD
eukprot:30324-Rhodomonas_salina.2